MQVMRKLTKLKWQIEDASPSYVRFEHVKGKRSGEYVIKDPFQALFRSSGYPKAKEDAELMVTLRNLAPEMVSSLRDALMTLIGQKEFLKSFNSVLRVTTKEQQRKAIVTQRLIIRQAIAKIQKAIT